MASVGHWDSITEAEKLTNNLLVGGIVEENIKVGGIVPLLPVAQFSGLRTTWNRESTIPSGANAVSGSQIVWEEAAKLVQIERTARIKVVATLLDHYVEEVHGNFNNYAAIQLMNDKKAMLQRIEDSLIYDDETFGQDTEEMEGLHALAADANGITNFHGETLNIDGAEGAPALEDLRILEDNMLHGVDVWLMPKVIARQLDRYVQEQGLTTNTFGQINFTINDLGKKVTHFNGVPIIRSQFMVAEEANTGNGDQVDRRAKNSSGTEQFSVFGLKFGQVMRAEPGLTLGFGNKSGQVNAGELWKTVMFEDLEDQDSGGIRLVAYTNLMDGSSVAVCRLFDIIDAAWVSAT